MTLLPIYRSLLGLPDPEAIEKGSTIKPLECVGTVDEARQSLLLAAERHSADIPQPSAGVQCPRCNPIVVAGRTAAERKCLPRNLQKLLEELRSIDLEPGSLERLRIAHVDDFNAEHNIPSWLVA